ncbi:MAG: hypothetical protein V4638_07345 [Bacteroidota bacterium]
MTVSASAEKCFDPLHVDAFGIFTPSRITKEVLSALQSGLFLFYSNEASRFSAEEIKKGLFSDSSEKDFMLAMSQIKRIFTPSRITRKPIFKGL